MFTKLMSYIPSLCHSPVMKDLGLKLSVKHMKNRIIVMRTDLFINMAVISDRN